MRFLQLLRDSPVLIVPYTLLDRQQKFFYLCNLPFRGELVVDLLHNFHALFERLLLSLTTELRS